MLDGIYIENSADRHIPLRRYLLEGNAPLPPLCTNIIEAHAATFPEAIRDDIVSTIHEIGVALIQLDEPLCNDRFIALGSLLGAMIPETDPAVLPYVERDVILNLVSAHGHTPNVALQPFAANYLSLHTEGSGRPREEQPSYIVLMCCEPGDNTTTAQTVLVPMRTVEQRLAPEHIELLSMIRYRANDRCYPIVRDIDGRRVFAFRDFQANALQWRCTSQEADNADVNNAIRNLLAAMYSPDGAYGVSWKRGMLIIIDNRFFFHGRTVAPSSIPVRPRHLKRLRIL